MPMASSPAGLTTIRRAPRLSLGCAVAGLALWVYSVTGANFSAMRSMGLVSVLGWTFFLGLGLVVLGLSLELLDSHMNDGRLILLILAMIVFMFGTASAVEPVASLGDSWLHAGFIQYFLQHGHGLNAYDARFSWPGGFSLGAVLVSFAGQANALAFLRWFPLFVQILYLAPLLVIARFSGVSRRTGWLGVVLFFATDWIYQDYFSPQALNYFFYLVVIATVLACLQPQRRTRATWIHGSLERRVDQIRSFFHRGNPPIFESVPIRSNRTTFSVLGLASLVCLASAMSHQLTPYAIALALFACLVTRRLGWPELVAVAALFPIGWLSLGATDFWVGHLSTIFGSVGQISTTIGANVTSRVTGSASHRYVVDTRILITAALFALAGIGVLIRRPYTRTLEALAGAPFLLVAAQSYGGEALLRVVFYGLPFTAMLAASAVLPSRTSSFHLLRTTRILSFSGRRRLRLVTVTLIVFVFALVTFVVRGGNDAYESFSTGELSAVNYVYNHIKSGETIGMVISYLPLGQRDVGTVNYFAAAYAGGTPTLAYDQRELLKVRPEFVILSRSQDAWGQIVEGFPPGWETALKRQLLRHGYRTSAEWTTATVLKAQGGTIGVLH